MTLQDRLPHVRSRPPYCHAVALSDPISTASALNVRAMLQPPNGERNTAKALVKRQESRLCTVCQGVTGRQLGSCEAEQPPEVFDSLSM